MLKGLTLAIPAGSTVAFVGPTGAGKSSILHLLPRLFDPTRGSITWDGLDLQDARLETLRRQIGLVPQDAVLLNATVYDNIRFGLDGVSDAAVRSAAHRAAADDVIDQLPQGYDTVVGQSGVGLSGGQRQRIALARAILRDPSVLILDEATSALDATTQRRVQERLGSEGSRQCIIKVAHRLETVVDADIIFVLDDGRLVEQGPHAELLALGGLYARLFADQTAPLQEVAASAASLATHRLQRRAPFSELAPAAVDLLTRRLRPVTADAGTELYRNGDPADVLYVLMRGRVELRFPRGDGRTTVNEVEPGELLGDSTFLAGRSRPATALVTSNASLFCLTRDDWEAIENVAHATPDEGSKLPDQESAECEGDSARPEAAHMVRSRPPDQTFSARTASDRSTSRLPRP